MDDIGKIISAVSQIISLASTVAGKAPSMVMTPIEANINSVTTAQTLLEQLLASNAEIAAKEAEMGLAEAEGAVKEQLEKDKESRKKTEEEAKKKEKQRKKKKKKDKKEKEKNKKNKKKTKIDKILEKIKVINDRLTQINQDITELEEEKAKVDENVAKILASQAETIVPDKDPAKMTDKEKLEFQKKQLIAERTELKCKLARILATNEDNEQLTAFADSVQNKVFQEASKLPINLIEVIEAIVDYIINLLTGIKAPKDEEEFDVKEIIDEIKEKVEELPDKLKELPVPEVPVLSKLSPVLDVFKKMADPLIADKDDIDGAIPELPNMPTAFVSMISDLWGTILNILILLPMILINLIFQIFKCIIQIFKDIKAVIGVPDIPYPLNLVDKVLDLLPDIWEFIVNTPGKITAVVKRLIMEKFKEIQYLSLPQPSVGGIPFDASAEVCPKHEDA